MLSFVIFPIVFYLNRDFISEKQVKRISYLFSISVVILILFQLFQLAINYDFIASKLSPEEIKLNGYESITEMKEETIQKIKLRRFRNFIIKVSNTHTTYQGLWISFSIFFLSLSTSNEKKNKLKILNIFLILILSFWLYLISARMPLIALLGASFVTIMVFSKFTKKVKLLISLVTLTFIIVINLFNNPISVRIKEYYRTGTSILNSKKSVEDYNSSIVRNGVYFCDIQLLKKAPLLGVGVGDTQKELNNCYSEKIGAEIYQWHTYNTHNQYLFFWISAGLFGFLSFLFKIGYLFKKSFDKKQVLLFFFILLSATVFLSENLLERSDGVIFFSFFSALFYFNQNKS
ncbi:O-antigen ligase [uncultured Tenacibaculum sp.]|uniref:O-antigen ligase family protein n=1 Tax=uncultured Tenacibaculum sp. TaxID=174713 RepID=UPI00260CAE19|nr:O-antigen ligase family protein [uncultured Tenacibaculum sp.]